MPVFRRWKAASACSEQELLEIARRLARELGPGDRVLLEGPMGAGKTTFTRALLEGLGVLQPAEGSPSFAIAHEYSSPRFDVIHIDFYRIKSEAEIVFAGIEAYFWERSQALVIAEWTSLWAEFEAAVEATVQDKARIWRVELAFSPQQPLCRELEIKTLF